MKAATNPGRSAAAGRAFTLVELLVVIAILVLLLSIFLPSLSRSRDLTRATACRIRMNQLYKACVEYSVGWGGAFPHYDRWLWRGYQGGDSSRWVESGDLWPFVRNRDVYFCPADDKTRVTGKTAGSDPLAIGSGGGRGDKPIHSYVRIVEVCGYVNSHFQDATGMRGYYSRPLDLMAGVFAQSFPNKNLPGTTFPYSSLPTHPARAALFYEEAQGTEPGLLDSCRWSSVYGLNALLNDGLSYYTAPQDIMTIRHLGNGNLVFFDGHVMQADAKRYNNYPLDGYTEAVVLSGIEPAKP